MKRVVKIAAAAVAMTVLSVGAAFASGWQRDSKGWWYGINVDNSAWHANGWQWVDGDGDGIAECYYFDSDGYCLMNAATPDGYKVNENGAWLVDGVIQTQEVAQQSVSNSSAKTTASFEDLDSATQENIKEEIWNKICSYAKSKLKYPNTAKFPTYNDSGCHFTYSSTKESVYRGWCEAKNGLGNYNELRVLASIKIDCWKDENGVLDYEWKVKEVYVS